MSDTQLSVLTFNVHAWRDARMVNNVHRVIALIKRTLQHNDDNASATVICLNEVTMPQEDDGSQEYLPPSNQKLCTFHVIGPSHDDKNSVRQFRLLACKSDSPHFIHMLICHHLKRPELRMGEYKVTPLQSFNTNDGDDGPLETVSFDTLHDGQSYTIELAKDMHGASNGVNGHEPGAVSDPFIDYYQERSSSFLFDFDESHSLKYVAQSLGFYFVYGPTCSVPNFGNAILSTERFKTVENATTPHGDQRSFLHVTFSHEQLKDNHPLKHLSGGVVCTHLDHVKEETRLSEWTWAKQKHAIPDTSLPHIVCGDFNALCPHDYTDARLQVIDQERIESNWERCKFGLYNKITAEQGYVDCYLQLNKKQSNPGTSRFDTRIDYIFLGGKPSLECVRCEIIKDETGASDHLPVLAVFQVS